MVDGGDSSALRMRDLGEVKDCCGAVGCLLSHKWRLGSGLKSESKGQMLLFINECEESGPQKSVKEAAAEEGEHCEDAHAMRYQTLSTDLPAIEIETKAVVC